MISTIAYYLTGEREDPPKEEVWVEHTGFHPFKCKPIPEYSRPVYGPRKAESPLPSDRIVAQELKSQKWIRGHVKISQITAMGIQSCTVAVANLVLKKNSRGKLVVK